jgi:Amt family ammonium transporter
MVTVGEFVETQLTLDTLREIGIDYAQGYFLGRPGPLV